MSTDFDLLDTFAQHETVAFNVEMRNRAGEALPGAETAEVALVVSADAARATKVFEVTEEDALEAIFVSGSTWQFKPGTAKLALLVTGQIYYYDIWSVTAADGRLHQVNGKIRLDFAAREA